MREGSSPSLRAAPPPGHHRELARRLRELADGGGAPPSDDEVRRLNDDCRALLRAYRQQIASASDSLREAARAALLYLGGDGDGGGLSLKHYDHLTYGPFLGVSDEGSAAPIIRQAAFGSPKGQVLGPEASPLALGMGHDAERLGAVGEVVVGPGEYADIWLECADRILTTTNVGTRLNVRYYRPYPVINVPGGDVARARARVVEELRRTFAPFRTGGSAPRPLTAYVQMGRGAAMTAAQQRRLLRALVEDVAGGDFATPGVHRLGLSVRIGWGPAGRDQALWAIDMAAGVGIEAVAIDGVLRKAADDAVSLPGLLGYLAPGLVGPVLRRAVARGVKVRTRNDVDADTVARGLWGLLEGARGFGLHLGKYGVLPLSLEETERVVGLVQGWFGSWSAAPVLFVDQPLLAADRVHADGDRARGAEAWLDAVGRQKVPVVLIDTADKAKGWRIYRRGRDDKQGLLGPQQIRRLDGHARGLGIKVLWAGGLTMADAYALGREQVFGVYVTSAAARAVPVPPEYERDPLLASVKEPSAEGVARTKLLLEAGFLVTALAGEELSGRIAAAAEALLGAIERQDGAGQVAIEAVLRTEAIAGWRRHLKGGPGARRSPA